MHRDRRLAKLPIIAMPQNQKMKDRLMKVKNSLPKTKSKPKAKKPYKAKMGDWTESKMPKAMYSKKGTGLNPSYK